jgi:hypothetical protein
MQLTPYVQLNLEEVKVGLWYHLAVYVSVYPPSVNF